MEKEIYQIKDEDSGQRIDKFLTGKKNLLSRSYLQKLIDDNYVLVNGRGTKRSYRLNPGDKVILKIPKAKEPKIKPVPMELDIIYEDEHILVVNKPPGLVVHPVPGNFEKTLVNGLMAHTDNLSGINGVKRPGIVHRLDKDTSGALVVAKNDLSHRELVQQFKKRETKKIYRTIVKGHVPYEKGKIDAPIGRHPTQRKKMAVTKKNSKKAITYFNVLKYFEDFTYLEIEIKTGRTHQIRVHLSYLGYPVLGDDKYGRGNNKLGVTRQLLHAYRLGIFHPLSNEWLEFTAPLPEDFKKILELLSSD